MKKSRFTDSQIMAVLNQAQSGTPVPNLCREHGISSERDSGVLREHLAANKEFDRPAR